MTSSLQTVPVTFTRRNPSHDKNTAAQPILFAASPTVQDMGPKPTTLDLEFVVNGPANMDATVRRIADLLAFSSFAVVADPTSIYYADGHAFVKAGSLSPRRMERQTVASLPATYVGNSLTHRVGVVATSRQLANYWEIPGLTALRVPAGCTLEAESLTDAARGVIRTPAAFASQDATYSGGRTYRNGGASVRAHATTPASVYSDWMLQSDGATTRYGIGVDLSEGYVQAPSLRANLSAAADTLTLTDLAGVTGASARTLTLAAFALATPGIVGLPVTPQRTMVYLDNGQVLTLHNTGNLHLRPAGLTFKVPGGVTRALGPGVFWHSIGGAAYLVGTVDFAVAGDGTVTYGAPTLGSELLSNGGFETYAATPGLPASWTKVGSLADSAHVRSTNVHGGAYALQMTADGANLVSVKQALSGLVVGTPARVKAFAKTGGTGQVRLTIRNTTDSVDTTTVDGTAAATNYELLETAFTPVAGKSYEVRVGLVGATPTAGQVAIVDDVSAKTILGQGANDASAVFGVAFTSDVGAARTSRLRELLADVLQEWYLEAR